MANQDYISRSPAKKKPNNKRGKTKAKQSNTISLKTKLFSIVLLLLIAAFSYGLWSLKTDPSTKTPLVAPVKDQKENKSTREVKALPKPPKEKWTYVEDLKHKEIEVGEYIVEKKGPYKMQCGSFKTQAQAESLKARIAFAGLEAQVKGVTGKNGTWYKVFLGPYSRKREAEKHKHILKRKRNNITGCQIWGWQ